MKIKVNDQVLVTTGKYKGKTGKVLRIYRKTNRLTVEKINLRTRHIPKKANQSGQKVIYEAAFSASNVMLICPNCTKAVRVGYKKEDNSKKYRVCKKCQQPLNNKLITAKKLKA